LDYRVRILWPPSSFYYFYRVYVLFEWWIDAGCVAESKTRREAAEGSGTGVRYDCFSFVFFIRRFCRFDRRFNGFFFFVRRWCQSRRRLLFPSSSTNPQHPFLFFLLFLFRINTILLQIQTQTLLTPEPEPESEQSRRKKESRSSLELPVILLELSSRRGRETDGLTVLGRA